jgi:hypothetical protein
MIDLKFSKFVCAAAFFFAQVSLGSVESYDIVIYGGTSSGVIAAVQAAKMGRSVVLIEPSQHVGGMTSNGLSRMDIGRPTSIGGLTRTFLHNVWKHYHAGKESLPGAELTWVLEPHVAEHVFDSMLHDTKVPVVRGERLDREQGIVKKGQRIEQITMESGRTFKGVVFIDASYEGDLLASSGVSYRVGREGNGLYNETLNGMRLNVNHNDLPSGIDPYLVKGDPTSGLLPRIQPPLNGADGDGDGLVQSYNYRMNLTKVPGNRVLVEKPANYNDVDYEIVFRAIQAGLPVKKFFKLDPIPNGKTDSNNFSGISTDFIGMNTPFVEADYTTRAQIARAHEDWQRGLIWTLQNHPRTPPAVKAYYAGYGLPKDEFEKNNHWPYQLYVREARRMIGENVITEHHALSQVQDSDGIGIASYAMDSHAVQYFVGPDGFLSTEGEMYFPLPKPFSISYRAIVPKRGEVTNLLVPVCLSATHAAYGSIRMEPVFMMLGQSAATAASLAVEHQVNVQDVDYVLLKEKLARDGQVLE